MDLPLCEDRVAGCKSVPELIRGVGYNLRGGLSNVEIISQIYIISNFISIKFFIQKHPTGQKAGQNILLDKKLAKTSYWIKSWPKHPTGQKAGQNILLDKKLAKTSYWTKSWPKHPTG